MEEKLVMQRREKGLNVARRHKRRMKQKDSRQGSWAKMCRLADLASCFVLPICVQVGSGLRNKYNKKHSQAECKQPRKLLTRFRLADHFEFLDYPKLIFDATNFSW